MKKLKKCKNVKSVKLKKVKKIFVQKTMKKVLKMCRKAYNISFFILKRQLKMHISKF